MKRGTRTWKLWWMVIVHILAIIGITGIVTLTNIHYPGIWNWFLLIGLTFINYGFLQNMYYYIDRIKDRKKRML
jgi:hypothetical protein